MRMKLCWMQSSLPNPIAPIRASGPAVKGASKQDWKGQMQRQRVQVQPVQRHAARRCHSVIMRA
ncbi:hypothetical protein J3E69DRAFT_339065 [Trichoderma sp. SZMC 28015]